MSSPCRCALLLPAILWLGSTAAEAANWYFVKECENRLPRPNARVERIDSGYTLRTDLSYNALTDLGASVRKHGKIFVLGLTRAETASRVNIQMERLFDQLSGQECVSPQVRITVAYQPLQVYIGHEFPKDSCAYREILKHEMRHVETYQDHLPKVEGAIRMLLAQRLDGKILFGEKGTVEKKLKEDVTAYWLPTLDREIRKVEELQAQIDTTQEYERLEKVCGGEVRRLMHARGSE